mmetsp:Transcript_33585/g.106832  ORF Transcript_33585/g.106832 Transcript_33585/m.106832 type:complete len:163 (+) Transcript_33585:194-682(+)
MMSAMISAPTAARLQFPSSRVLARGAPRSARLGAIGASRRGMTIRASSDSSDFIGRARIPAAVDMQKFQSNMFQWATSLTVSGQNMPFSLPLKVDRSTDGFTIGLMRVNDGKIETVCEIVARQEGEFFMIYEETESKEEFIDIPMIMGGMQTAIKKNVVLCQ